MAQCENCGNTIARPSARRARAWPERARFCSRACQYAKRPRRSVEERFWEKVERKWPNDCWPWKGAISGKGYGRFTAETKRVVTASRFAYELTHGPLANPSIMVRHRCDNPACCNPSHLELGSALDNEHDKIRRGRNRKAIGERAPTAKLTADQVREIRARYAAGATQAQLATEFGVRDCTVSAIVNRLTWRHL